MVIDVLIDIDVMSNAAPSVGYNYTPLWTAPEVLVGDYNSKVDIWSLGCVIIEMASGKPPWSEENFENPFRALYHIGNSGSIPKIPDTVSAVGRAFILLCLERYNLPLMPISSLFCLLLPLCVSIVMLIYVIDDIVIPKSVPMLLHYCSNHG
jgi:serine/threonine protein kinase